MLEEQGDNINETFDTKFENLGNKPLFVLDDIIRTLNEEFSKASKLKKYFRTFKVFDNEIKKFDNEIIDEKLTNHLDTILQKSSEVSNKFLNCMKTCLMASNQTILRENEINSCFEKQKDNLPERVEKHFSLTYPTTPEKFSSPTKLIRENSSGFKENNSIYEFSTPGVLRSSIEEQKFNFNPDSFLKTSKSSFEDTPLDIQSGSKGGKTKTNSKLKILSRQLKKK